MRSQLRFIMHPDDERDFVAHILSDDRVFLIDEHSNDPAGPPLLRSIEPVAGSLCSIVLRPAGGGANDTSAASGKIQFSRSQIVGPLITEGRIAIGTTAGSEEAAWVERQYKALSKFIKARYTNSILRWYNPNLPFGPGEPGRSANPGKPDPQVWVGPSVRGWLAENPERRIKQHWSYGALAFLEPQPAG